MRATARLTGLTCATLLMLASCAESEEIAPGDESASTRADSAELAAAGDGQWLSLTGAVVSAAPDSFVLDYGAGNVVVEMDDWDSYQEGRILKAGDRVTVSGLADQDLLLNKRIEARSVYVRGLNSFFFASSADEEELRSNAFVPADATNHSNFTGNVSAIEGREFTLGTGPTAVRVDTSLLANNPFDSQGFQQIRVGDRVFAWGDIDLDADEGAEFKARGLISLVRNGTARPGATAGAADRPVAPGSVADQPVAPGGAADQPVANRVQPDNASTPVTNNAVDPAAN